MAERRPTADAPKSPSTAESSVRTDLTRESADRVSANVQGSRIETADLELTTADPALLLDAPESLVTLPGPSRGEPPAGRDGTVELTDAADAELPAMYLDPTGAYEEFQAQVTEAEAAVDEAEDEYLDALQEVDQVAKAYQDALESGDPTALQAAQAELNALQTQVSVYKGQVDDAQQELDEAEGELHGFEAQYPQVVEDVTGLTPDQHRDLDEYHDLQDDVSVAQARLDALSDDAFEQAVTQQQNHWLGEKVAAGNTVTVEETEVDIAAVGVLTQFNSVLAAMPAAAALDPSLLAGAGSFDPKGLQQLQADLADPTVDPHTAFATFVGDVKLLPDDHPSMIALNQQLDHLAAAREDLAESQARLNAAETALASLDDVSSEHQALRDELEQQLDDAEHALDDFEQEHPDIDDWIDTDLEQAQADLDVAERAAEAIEDARIEHLENALDDLARLDEAIENGGDDGLASNVGLATFVNAEANATDTLDQNLDDAEHEVEVAQNEVHAIAGAEAGEDGSPEPTLTPIAVPDVQLDADVPLGANAELDRIDFGSGDRGSADADSTRGDGEDHVFETVPVEDAVPVDALATPQPVDAVSTIVSIEEPMLLDDPDLLDAPDFGGGLEPRVDAEELDSRQDDFDF